MGKVCFGCLKVFVVIINSLFLLIGLAILGVSLFLFFDTRMKALRENSGSQQPIEIALYVAMGVGGLTALVSAFGCCGALHESSCLLGAFFVCLLLICGVEIGGGVYLYMTRLDVEQRGSFVEAMRNVIKNTNATTIPEPIKVTQKILECCGANGSKDYEDPKVAEEVCRSDDGTKQFTQGCVEKILSQSLYALIAILCIAGLEIISMIVAMYLCCAAKRDEEGYVGVSAD